jgi:hypothetical protein
MDATQINWASGISLATLLGVVFFGGVFVQKLTGIQQQLSELLKTTVPRIHERLDSQEGWRAHHEGAHEEREKAEAREARFATPRERTYTEPGGSR